MLRSLIQLKKMVIRLLSLNFNVNYNYMNWVLYDYNKLENLKLFLKSIYGDINLQPLIKFNEKGKFADVGINILHKRELNGYTVVGYILVKKKKYTNHQLNYLNPLRKN